MSFGSMLSNILKLPPKISEAFCHVILLQTVLFWADRVVGLLIRESSDGG